MLTRRTLLCAMSAGSAACATMPAPTAGARPEIYDDASMEAALPRLSNWGRWGEGDRLGALNLIDPRERRRALARAQSGRILSLARANTIEELESGRIERHQRTMLTRETVRFTFHGFAMTHLDALCHIFADERRLYNGVPAEVVTEAGCSALDVTDLASGGIAAPAVLLDMGRYAANRGRSLAPGDALHIADLEAAEREQGVRVRSGDALILRTGLGRANARARRCGLHPECVAWLRERDIALFVSDGDGDVSPCPGFDRYASAMHTVALPHLGVPLVDNAELEELADVCRQMSIRRFALIIGPLNVRGLSGSPVSPIALL